MVTSDDLGRRIDMQRTPKSGSLSRLGTQWEFIADYDRLLGDPGKMQSAVLIRVGRVIDRGTSKTNRKSDVRVTYMLKQFT